MIQQRSAPANRTARWIRVPGPCQLSALSSRQGSCPVVSSALLLDIGQPMCAYRAVSFAEKIS